MRTGAEKIKKTIVEEMESIPAGANPFHHDSYYMGTTLVRGWLVMHEGFDRPEDPRALESLYLVNTRSGQRIRVVFEYEEYASCGQCNAVVGTCIHTSKDKE